MTPNRGILTLRNISIVFLTSNKETFWGVVITTLPLICTSCVILRGISPVPGGKSMSSQSSSPQETFVKNWRKIWLATGALIAVSCEKKALEMNWIPKPIAGTIFSPLRLGILSSGNICLIEGPYKSASIIPTLLPFRARAAAIKSVKVDLPTPPLPAAIAMIFGASVWMIFNVIICGSLFHSFFSNQFNCEKSFHSIKFREKTYFLWDGKNDNDRTQQ